MKTITLHQYEIHKGPLILVNQDYPYIDNDNLKLEREKQISLEKKTLHLYHHILDDINDKGNILAVSGYRTFQQQKDIYEKSRQGQESPLTNQYAALPGCSEHHTGYALDISLTDKSMDIISSHASQCSILSHFKQRALQYGFIQRYTKEKKTITHIDEELWHFRYVGIPHAAYMDENNLCLEEYIEEIKHYHLFQPLQYVFLNQLFSIFYIPASQESIHLTLKDKVIYQISGNNIDGFIVTVWSTYV